MDNREEEMKIAITGGIGSGKSFVCRELKRHGIRVYDSDAAAKRLMRNDKPLQQSLCSLVGEDVYDAEGVLQKPVLARFLLASEANKLAVNDVVHPAVARDFEQSDFDWLESAILFESGFIHRTHFDFVVCVTAPEEVRIQRVMARDHIDRSRTLEWLHAQMSQAEVAARCDFEIVNDGKADVAWQVNLLLERVEEWRKAAEKD